MIEVKLSTGNRHQYRTAYFLKAMTTATSAALVAHEIAVVHREVSVTTLSFKWIQCSVSIWSLLLFMMPAGDAEAMHRDVQDSTEFSLGSP